MSCDQIFWFKLSQYKEFIIVLSIFYLAKMLQVQLLLPKQNNNSKILQPIQVKHLYLHLTDMGEKDLFTDSFQNIE